MSKVPKLRFKDFSGDWESKKLGELGEFFKGSMLSKSNLSEEGKPCILYGELYTKYNEVIKNVISKTNLNDSKLVWGEKNDVLIPSSGETSIDIATASCLQQDNVILGGDLNVFRSNKLNGIFASYQLNNSKRNEIAKLSQGASVVHLYNTQLSKLKLNVPSIEEQEKIASFFSLIDDKISLQGEKLEMLKSYKKGMMQKIFSRELRFKDDDGRDYPEWEEKKLGDVSDVLSGKRVPKGMSLVEYNTNIPYITVSDMGDKYVNTTNLRYITSEIEECIKKYKVIENDIIISVAGTLGKINVIHKSLENANLTENCDKITNFKGVYYKYIYYYLNSKYIQNQIQSVNTISSQPKLALNCIRDFDIDIPSYKEQCKISDFLKNLDLKIEKEQEKLNSLNEYKKGLLQKMFV